jgi:hypothetical protein
MSILLKSCKNITQPLPKIARRFDGLLIKNQMLIDIHAGAIRMPLLFLATHKLLPMDWRDRAESTVLYRFDREFRAGFQKPTR